MKKGALFLVILLTTLWFGFKTINTKPATEFLNSLDDQQRQKTLFSFDDLSRNNWYFLPGAMLPRAGIQLHELTANQKVLLFKLLESCLSNSGYNKAKKIIELENVLAEIDGNSNFRDPKKYFVAFYGNPEKDSLWAWSFEGHHLSLNFTNTKDKSSIAPRFLGASPATITSGERRGDRTLSKENDYGLKLINSMSTNQMKKTVFQEKPYMEVVTSNAIEVSPLRPVGIKMEELTDDQQIILLNLINEYISILPDDIATDRLNKLKEEEFKEIMFGWAGGIKINTPHYYRIQGKSFLVEFDNPLYNANHIHTVWRDFDGDFGRDLIREHYKESHHH